MGNGQEKEGFFKKLVNIISGNPPSGSEEGDLPKGKYSPVAPEPIDLRFVQNFTQSGGNFLYCKSRKELLSNLKNVCSEENVSHLFVCESDVEKTVKEFDIEVSRDPKRSNAICSTCEALIASTGGVMIDDLQTGGVRLGELPEVHIIVGNTTQIVENLHAGMALINNKYKEKRPGQITTLKGANEESVKNSTNDQNANRVLYLLLYEDELQ